MVTRNIHTHTVLFLYYTSPFLSLTLHETLQKHDLSILSFALEPNHHNAVHAQIPNLLNYTTYLKTCNNISQLVLIPKGAHTVYLESRL